MTDAELFGCFDLDRQADGAPKPPPAAPPPPPRELFRRHCELNCVTDPAAVARLWADRQAAARAGGSGGH